MQFAVPAFHAVGTGEGDVLSLRRPKDFVSPMPHGTYQVFPAVGSFHLGVYRGDQLKFPALIFLRCSKLPRGEFCIGGFLYDLETVSDA